MSKKPRQFHAIFAIIASSIFLGACTPFNQTSEPSKPAASPTSQAANSPTKPAAAYYGFVDYRDCEFVKGWVYNKVNPTEDINVAVYVDDKLIETIPAKTLRADVKSQNIGTGQYGFSFTIPSQFKDEKTHMVNVKVAGSDYSVPYYQGVISGFKCKQS